MVKLDVSGNVIWTKEFQANFELEGTPSVCQQTNGDFLISTLGMEMGLTKLSSNGNLIFQKRYSIDTVNLTKTPPVGAAMGTDGGVLICAGLTGLGLVKTDAAGNIQWTKDFYDNSFTATYIADAVVGTSDGGFAIAGTDYYSGSLLLMKVDMSGNIVWKKNYSSNLQITVTGFTVAPNNNFQVAGVDYSSKAIIAQFDSNGNYISGGIIGSQNQADDQFTNVAIHSCQDNGMLIGGLCQNTITGSIAISLFKTDISGNMGCQYHPITMNDNSSSFSLPVDAQTIVYSTNVTGSVLQDQMFVSDLNSIETDFCMLFSVNETVENPISLNVFPSPISSGENLQLNISGINGSGGISIYDANGKVVKQFNHEFFPDQSEMIDVSTSDMSSGIYLVRITGADEKILASTKFIVK
jgi:hypothetical protein